jgi:hypothetical protein
MSAAPTPSDLEAEIARLRAELLASRAEARALAEAMPHALNRRAALRSLVADLVSPTVWVAGARRTVGRALARVRR